MAMIETVRQRQKNSVDFPSCYDNLCALQNSCPLGSITANLDELTIDCNADRIRHSDWMPILNALKINKTLKSVAFRSYWQQTLYPDGGKQYWNWSDSIQCLTLIQLFRSLDYSLQVYAIRYKRVSVIYQESETWRRLVFENSIWVESFRFETQLGHCVVFLDKTLNCSCASLH